MGNAERQRIYKVDTTLHGKGLDSAWRKATVGSELIILSPYVTSRTAEQVVAAAGPCRIYTLFDLDTFAQRSSSLSTLKRLIDTGHRVYCLRDLHAKVVIAPEGFASVGSQNLTQAGTRRREISATFTDARVPESLLKIIEPWLTEAWLVTPDDVADMEKDLKPLLKAYKAVQEQAQEGQSRFEARRQQREERQRAEAERQSRLDAQRERAARLIRLSEYVARSRQPGDEVKATVYSSYSEGRRDNLLFSLTVRAHQTLTEWNINGRTIELENQHRYLCLSEDTGAIGWARVNTTQISFISAQREDPNPIRLGGIVYDLSFTGKHWTRIDGDANVEIGICTKGDVRPHVIISGYFDGADLDILDTRLVDKSPFWPFPGQDIMASIERDREGVRERLIAKMLMPYVPYKERKAGDLVPEFFGGHLTDIYLRVMTGRGQKFLVAKRGYYNDQIR